jgi:membrane carboxypeptidase/penicillin-binding protein PbpC
MKNSTRDNVVLSLAVFLFLGVFFGAYSLTKDAESRYANLLSVVTYDRNGVPLRVGENSKGHRVLPLTGYPPGFIELLMKKEDRFFILHNGVNALSTVRALYRYLLTGHSGGSSTITEQLAKNLLNHENDRTITHKLVELAYALSLELFVPKGTILTMYAHTVYLGNQVQGFEAGSWAYFGESFRDTTRFEQIALLATLSHPTSRNPWAEENEIYSFTLYSRLVGEEAYAPPRVESGFSFQNILAFELNSLPLTCVTSCRTTLDQKVTEDLRKILARMVTKESYRGARHGAIVVIDAEREELIALVGSPDPTSAIQGNQINMALEPRPIGSTVKPLIYLKGFEAGLRPYTLVDDREYKYPIATGYSLYPKNYDGKYHGEVTLHEALGNSLNVPTVKTLEYIGLSNFYTFLETTLRFKPLQPLDSYQYGIALGGLEMDLLTLSHFMTVFPRNGTIAPLRISDQGGIFTPPQSDITAPIKVVESEYTELVTAILKDRLTGVSQFGLVSNLNLHNAEYAVKTGTSRDFHDSWVVGYTPELVVGVWIGNAENEPLAQVSGLSGAGSVWHEVMEYLLASPYAQKSTFRLSNITPFPIGASLEWGLTEDITSEHRTLLIDDRLITSIHQDDSFELTTNTTIPLRAKESVTWFVDGSMLASGVRYHFSPTPLGLTRLRLGPKTIDARFSEYILLVLSNGEDTTVGTTKYFREVEFLGTCGKVLECARNQRTNKVLILVDSR